MVNVRNYIETTVSTCGYLQILRFTNIWIFATYKFAKRNYRFRRSRLPGRPSAYAARVHRCNRRFAVTGADAEEAIVSSTARSACAPIMISFIISFPSLVPHVPHISIQMRLFIYVFRCTCALFRKCILCRSHSLHIWIIMTIMTTLILRSLD